MLAKVIEIPIPHEVCEMRCRACGHECVSVHPVGMDHARAECSRCGAFDSEVIGPKADVVPLQRTRNDREQYWPTGERRW
jgi:hypothetical protein